MPEASRSSVLVVDDDEDVRALVVLYLQLGGFDVREASTVDAGLQALADQPPDVVVSDLNFGADSGDRLVRRCLEIGQPVLLMTASVETRDLSADLRSSVRILRKPFTLEELTDAVNGALVTGRRSES